LGNTTAISQYLWLRPGLGNSAYDSHSKIGPQVTSGVAHLPFHTHTLQVGPLPIAQVLVAAQKSSPARSWHRIQRHFDCLSFAILGLLVGLCYKVSGRLRRNFGK
jgi:hypothetical protein